MVTVSCTRRFALRAALAASCARSGMKNTTTKPLSCEADPSFAIDGRCKLATLIMPKESRCHAPGKQPGRDIFTCMSIPYAPGSLLYIILRCMCLPRCDHGRVQSLFFSLSRMASRYGHSDVLYADGSGKSGLIKNTRVSDTFLRVIPHASLGGVQLVSEVLQAPHVYSMSHEELNISSAEPRFQRSSRAQPDNVCTG